MSTDYDHGVVYLPVAQEPALLPEQFEVFNICELLDPF